MRRVKIFGIGLVGLFIVITIFSLVIPSRVTTVRSVVINTSIEKIGQQVFNINNWKHWHPVFLYDSANIRISPMPTGINAYAVWNTGSKKSRIVFTGLSSNRVEASMERTGENPVLNIISIVPINDSTGNQVEWRTLTKLKWYPWEKFAGIFADKVTGPGYEMALNNLKQYCESH